MSKETVLNPQEYQALHNRVVGDLTTERLQQLKEARDRLKSIPNLEFHMPKKPRH